MQRILLFVPVVIAIVVALVALYPEKELPPIKVGILHSLTGTMAISEKPVMQATLLAVEQINAKGGLLGRKVEAVVVDGQSDWPTFARQAEYLIVDEKVSVVFGGWTSASRKTVKPIFEQYNHLLFYPVQYEGLEQSPNIIYTGAAPNQQIIPAVSWALKEFGSRIYLVGSDYVFPRVANWLIAKQVSMLGGSIIGQYYLPLGSRDVQDIIQDIQRLKPDVVMNSINGDSNVALFHALSQAGIQAKDIPVLSFSMGEAELAHMQADHVSGHYAAWNYFQSIDSQQNHDFVAAYQTRFGADLPLSDPMQAAWAGVHLWAKAVQAAQSDDHAVVRQTIAHQSILAPEGVISIDAKTQHTWKTARIGRIRADGQFDILWSSEAPLRPSPYPAMVSKQQADEFLQQLYDGWDQHWALPVSMQGDAL
ncbi:MAG: urea ABC transporter substrate-binding protein [Mariprofundus sp.]|nr:urea ABC transporter substrate-binding protein [Mariprofundus sp.]